MIGVTIDNIDTLTVYGLILCSDLKIGTPEPRTKYITVPEADGDLDLTGALTDGEVRYGMREISFSLFAAKDVIAATNSPATESHFAAVRSQLMGFLHGKRRQIWLPDDPDHYFIGRFKVGEKSGYNSGRIAVTMKADPWRYKNDVTTITVTASGTVSLSNELKSAVPTFTAEDAYATVTFNGVSHALAVGENVFSDIKLGAGMNSISMVGVHNPIVISYQEATL